MNALVQDCTSLQAEHQLSGDRRLFIANIVQILLVLLITTSSVISIIITGVVNPSSETSTILYYIFGAINIITTTTIPTIQKYFNLETLGTQNITYAGLFFQLKEKVKLTPTTPDNQQSFLNDFDTLITQMPTLFLTTYQTTTNYELQPGGFLSTATV
jgi:hypothetical protein